MIGVGFGSFAGLYLAARRAGTLTWVLNVLGAIAICAPAAVTGYFFIFLFGSAGGNNPVFFVSDSGVYRSIFEDPVRWLEGLWVPWLAIALPLAGAVTRVSTAANRDALGEESVRTALAKGVKPRRVQRRHVAIFAWPPISAYSSAAINLMILNAAIVETIFNLPGFVPLRQAGDRQPRHRPAADDGARHRHLRGRRQPDRRPHPDEGRPARPAERDGGPPGGAPTARLMSLGCSKKGRTLFGTLVPR